MDATKAFVSGMSSLMPFSSLPSSLPFFFAFTLTRFTFPSANFSICSVLMLIFNEKKHFIYQDGKNVFKHAVSNMADASEKIMTRNGLNNTDINFLVAHQANKRIIDATSNRMGIVDEKVLMNIHRYGNTTAATIPLILSDYESKFKKGDNIIFASFGAGFTWGAMFLKWAYNH